MQGVPVQRGVSWPLDEVPADPNRTVLDSGEPQSEVAPGKDAGLFAGRPGFDSRQWLHVLTRGHGSRWRRLLSGLRLFGALMLVALLAASCCCDKEAPLSTRRPTLCAPRITIRRFRSRVTYGANTTASRQTGRYSFSPPLSLAGDVELNPGPVTGPDAVAPPGELSIYHANVRSLKKQLGDLRACAPVLECHDVVAISETWLNDTVADSELEIGFPEHTWFRRDRGSRGGGVACAVRSSLLPLRLPDPAGRSVC